MYFAVPWIRSNDVEKLVVKADSDWGWEHPMINYRVMLYRSANGHAQHQVRDHNITSARLALLAGRQAAQAAFWALVRRTYYLVHTQSPGAKYPNLLSPSDWVP